MNRSRSHPFALASIKSLLLVFFLVFGPISTASASPLAGVPFNNVLLLDGANSDAAATLTVTISGRTGIGQMLLTYNDSGPKTITTLPNGQYSFTVPNNWSGTVTPSHVCYTFAPASR